MTLSDMELVRAKQQIVKYSNAFVTKFFTVMQAEEVHGPNFSWDTFPDMCARLVEAGWLAQVSEAVYRKLSEEQKNALSQFAYKSGEGDALLVLAAEDAEIERELELAKDTHS